MVVQAIKVAYRLNLLTKQKNIDVSIWRGDASEGRYFQYQVPALQNQTILDVVTWVQRNLEPNLSYRFACRVGMCGTCAMMVNGKPRWTCRTHVKKVIVGNSLTIAPLRNLPVINDLVCDMSVFFDKWKKATGSFHPSLSRDDAVEEISPDSSARRAVNAAIECINCAVCHAACDVVQMNPDYLGPAPLNRAWTLVNDIRDTANNERLKAVSGDDGCTNCHSQQSCTHYCPNLINPTKSIAGLKRATAKAALKGEI